MISVILAASFPLSSKRYAHLCSISDVLRQNCRLALPHVRLVVCYISSQKTLSHSINLKRHKTQYRIFREDNFKKKFFNTSAVKSNGKIINADIFVRMIVYFLYHFLSIEQILAYKMISLINVLKGNFDVAWWHSNWQDCSLRWYNTQVIISIDRTSRLGSI